MQSNTEKPELRFHNTMARGVERFESLMPGAVRMYTCGPTVHDFAHIGNFRAYVFEDLLRRVLRRHGYQVTQVMNLTDVDDKTIRKSRAAGLPLRVYTQKYIDAFFEDLVELQIERAEQYPAATDHVSEMIVLITKLLERGHAYRSEDGSVYFRIETCPAYGKLSHLDRSGLKAGARVSQDEYEKESVGDFALWKAWSEEDGDVAWEAPWGRGRPGWHIECSAMSIKYLGESFDIHTGGVDNVFPHHEDEIAQSECATGKTFARTWLHCAHLIVDGKKMSKSLGNFFTLRDLKGKGYTGREIRYVLMGGHYRQWLNFTMDSLDGARTALARVDEFRLRLRQTASKTPPSGLPAWAAERSRLFDAALADDLNTPAALAQLFELILNGNQRMNAGALGAGEAAAVNAMLDDWDRVLGVLAAPASVVPEEISRLVQERQAARTAKNWAESDRIRDALTAAGWAVKDTAQGPQLRKM